MRLTCGAIFGSVISKVYITGGVSFIPLLLRAMMSTRDSPFGPRGRMASMCSPDTVGFVDMVGGPKIAMANKYVK